MTQTTFPEVPPSLLSPGSPGSPLTFQAPGEAGPERAVHHGRQVAVNEEGHDDADEDIDRGDGDEDCQEVHDLSD